MHVAMILDRERLTSELAMLNRLSVGLMDEGAQLTRIVPTAMPGESEFGFERQVALARRIETPMPGRLWLTRLRARRLAEAMDGSVPDLLYVVGVSAWRLALELARQLGRPLVMDVWTSELVRRVPRPRAGRPIAGYTAPTPPIAEALRRRADPDLVSETPMGVPVPDDPRPVLENADESICIAAVGVGRDVPAYQAMLGGMRRVIGDVPQVEFILELRGPHDHDIWRHADRLNLLGNMSTISAAGPFRALLARCDLLLMPERYGHVRSVTLEAMANAMPIIASANRALPMLIDGETALLVAADQPENWANAMLRILRDVDAARRLGEAGWRYVRQHHRSAQQVAALMATFERVLHGETYAFDAAARSSVG